MSWEDEAETRRRFGFICPRSWEAMEPAAGRRRFCSHCREHVHAVETRAEFERHARAGHCVSLALSDGDRLTARPDPGAEEPPSPSPIGPGGYRSSDITDRLTGVPLRIPPPSLLQRGWFRILLLALLLLGLAIAALIWRAA